MMTGLAHGLSLAGLHPILYFERADFLYNAMDAIVNHLSCASKISRGEFSPAVIIRVTVGNKNKPLFTGPTHTQNPAQAMRHLVDFPVLEARSEEDLRLHYETARFRQQHGVGSTMVFEMKDLM
jgi:pyruvate/2-oxoglutarate/acetoin dehydrogenase E1 component